MKRLSLVGIVIGGCCALLGYVRPAAAVDPTRDVVSALCSRIALCAETNPKLRKQFPRKGNACVNQLSGKAGMNLWSRLGLYGERMLTLTDVDAMVANGKVIVNRQNLDRCLAEVNTLSCGALEEHVTRDLSRVDMILSDQGACPKVYAMAVSPNAPTGQLIESICSRYENCQKGVAAPMEAKQICLMQLNGATGVRLWEHFGLKKMRARLLPTEVEQRIASGELSVDVENLNRCRERLTEISCESFEKNVTGTNWDNVERIVSNRSPCPRVLKPSATATRIEGVYDRYHRY